MKTVKPNSLSGTVDLNSPAEAALIHTHHSAACLERRQQVLQTYLHYEITFEQEYLLNSKKLNYGI